MTIRVKYSSGKERFMSDEGTGVKSIPVGSGETGVEMLFSLPLVNVHCHWNGTMFNGPEERLPWVIEEQFSFQNGFCFVSFFSREGLNALSFGLVGTPYDAFYAAKLNQETCTYDITLSVRFEEGFPRPAKLSLFVDRSPRDWREALEDWRTRQKGGVRNYPAAAFEPVFCTWYAAHAAVTAKWCEQTAAKARKLGFGTFILDDGWCYDEAKRVSPQTLPDWYECVGDWTVSKKKFPDFRKHVQKVRGLGLNYLIWVAPFLLGVKSDIYARLSRKPQGMQGEVHEGHRLLNPEDADAAAAMVDNVVELMESSGADGLKVDFLDEVKGGPDAPRSEACRRFVTELSARVRCLKPDALLEFRQSYASPQMAPLATQFRAGDAPFDFMLNFRRVATIRMAMGDGVPVHADPAYWHASEMPENISRHFIAMMPGVPMLSMEISRMSPEAVKITRRWLAFYQAHRETLNFGHWEIGYRAGLFRYAAVSGAKERIVILADSAFMLDAILDEKNQPGILLNLTSEELDISFFRNREDCFGKRLAPEEGIPVGGLAEFEV